MMDVNDDKDVRPCEHARIAVHVRARIDACTAENLGALTLRNLREHVESTLATTLTDNDAVAFRHLARTLLMAKIGVASDALADIGSCWCNDERCELTREE